LTEDPRDTVQALFPRPSCLVRAGAGVAQH